MFNKSFNRPAVQMAKWTPYYYNLMWSSFTEVPPIRVSILTPRNLENLLAVSCTWWANYRVLTITIACILLTFGSISLIRGIRYAAVLPVPFLALAMIGLLLIIKGTDSYWIGVGLVNPLAVKANIKFSFKFISAKDWYLVDSISWWYEHKLIP